MRIPVQKGFSSLIGRKSGDTEASRPEVELILIRRGFSVTVLVVQNRLARKIDLVPSFPMHLTMISWPSSIIAHVANTDDPNFRNVGASIVPGKISTKAPKSTYG